MSSLKEKAARVVVTVSVTVELSGYGDTWTIKDAVANAEKTAIARLLGEFDNKPGFAVGGATCTRVVIDG